MLLQRLQSIIARILRAEDSVRQLQDLGAPIFRNRFIGH